MTIEEKARQLVGCDDLYCKSSDVNFCRTCITKPGKKSCREIANMLEVADFVIDKAVTWLRENATDYLDKIEDCYGGNEGEPQTWSFPDEFFTRFRKEMGTELKADHQKAIDTANELAAYKDKTYISEDFLARNGFEKREYAFRYYGDCAIIRKSGFLYCDDCAEISAQEIDSEAGVWRIEVGYLDGGSTQTLDVCTVGQMRMFLAIEGLTEIAKQLK